MFVCLYIIQFVVGSYIEPRVAGAVVSLSPFMVLFAVFFWTMLWGIAGAFIGVPILIALASLCARNPATLWIAAAIADRPARDDDRSGHGDDRSVPRWRPFGPTCGGNSLALHSIAVCSGCPVFSLSSRCSRGRTRRFDTGLANG
jgi:hypothetical protein